MMTEPHKFNANSKDASKNGLLAILRAETATIEKKFDEDSRFEFEITIKEKE